MVDPIRQRIKDNKRFELSERIKSANNHDNPKICAVSECGKLAEVNHYYYYVTRMPNENDNLCKYHSTTSHKNNIILETGLDKIIVAEITPIWDGAFSD